MNLTRKFYLAVLVCASICASSAETLDEGEERPARRYILTPLKFLGSIENLNLVKNATQVVVEKVSVPSKFEVRGWKDGRPKFEEVEPLGWDGKRVLQVDEGPLPVPDDMMARLKSLLTSTYYVSDNGGGISLAFTPTYRFIFTDPGRRLEVLTIKSIYILVVYQDGKEVGGTPPCGEARVLIAELRAMFAKEKSSEQVSSANAAARHR
jgi:hypothetical protein